ncbi:mucoidy inhibitor MuiA family protein [Fimbriiglobus ruber]|uniref:Aspartate ammonia-lyase n=1 Tax=Fimbriiglobus ruber TaxID=1908690 RepID=A0A225E9L8_9BACT|nr:mucoidy inhibitor MuiA family protein [Fimbriiglobus ruber]OWK47428.1 Aspartate ammonia-lyase [Fimbriiglobus ruber]
MPHRLVALLAAVFGLTAAAPAQEPKPATSKVIAVTVYQNTALITREVTTPDAAGPAEVVVSPLPPSTVASSLYAEGGDGIRVLGARYRTRAIAEDTREEVRKLETKLKEAQKKAQQLAADQKAVELNTQFLTKLEGFTAATLQHLTEKGQLDSEKTIALATFIRDTRTKGVKEEVTLKQQIEATQEEIAFTQRLLQERAGGVTRTERDAVVVIDKTKAGLATLRLNYLVESASWKPQYKLRAGTKEKDQVTIEYLAAVTQQTGEDWSGVTLDLSTAQPLLNAAPPDLRALEISIGSGALMAQQQGGQKGLNPGGYAMMNDIKKLEEQSKSLRAQSVDNLNKKEIEAGGRFANDAAAIEQYCDLLMTKDDIGKGLPSADGIAGGPSVTYHLKTKLTLPSRNDDQVLEIAKLDLAPKFYYKAVPVLTPQVYRLADLTNTTDYVLLPGEATMYLGTDFVGQTKMPLVAIGKPFTVGFGADPQLQVQRKLLDKSRTTQGGNQVLTFKYRILVNSYKSGPVDVQVWDRLPHAEVQQTIAVNVMKGELDLSKDPLYLRDDRPKNLLRWDVKIDPKQNAEKALSIDYDFKIEFEKTVNIGAFLAK